MGREFIEFSELVAEACENKDCSWESTARVILNYVMEHPELLKQEGSR